jgi:hypothetical protein
MPRTASDLPFAEQAFLRHLQTLALRYFLDNQTPDGLFLDRQRNFGPRLFTGHRSTAASGMGQIAVALASGDPFRLIGRGEAVERVARTLGTALARLPHTHGVMPHFTDAAGAAVGGDVCSTIDSAWLVAGGLWAAAFLRDGGLRDQAQALFDRIDFPFWTTSQGLIRHGANRRGRFLPFPWDRLNGETIFLYVLAAGAGGGRAWPTAGWPELRPFFGSVAGRRFVSADLGLFVFQYGLDLLDLDTWREPGGLDLHAQASTATEANYHHCRAAAGRFETYRSYWGLSAGDGPGEIYRCYAPGLALDGTAHLTATLASVAHRPGLVLDQLLRARHDRHDGALGRYGFSNVNADHAWVGRDMVGIDAGAAVLALDNFLANNRVRAVFHELPCVRLGLDRIGFSRTPGAQAAPEVARRRLAS